MKQLGLVMLVVLVGGCAFNRYVDEKGRDCRDNMVMLTRWVTCDESTATPNLAQPHQKVDLTVGR